MPILPILIAPHPALKAKAKKVETIGKTVLRLLDDMLDTMYDAPGIGLAAPQVGENLRLVVIDLATKNEPRQPHKMINPEIVWSSEELAEREEGCLSVPDIYADVTRPARVRVRWLDETGAPQECEADGLLSVCLQHEIDHLDGVLFYDRVSILKRQIILRKLDKLKRRL